MRNNITFGAGEFLMLGLAAFFDISEFVLDFIGTPLQSIVIGFVFTYFSTFLDIMAVFIFTTWTFVRFGEKEKIPSKKERIKNREKNRKPKKSNKRWISKANAIFEVLGIGAISSFWPGWIIFVYAKIKHG